MGETVETVAFEVFVSYVANWDMQRLMDRNELVKFYLSKKRINPI